jgi:hypothetical protein
MRDYKINADLETVNRLVDFAENLNCLVDFAENLKCWEDFAENLNCWVETYEGRLVNNYIIYGTDRIKIGKAKPRKFIIIQETYLNEWSSGLEITMTDNEAKVTETEKFLEEQILLNK